jgi:Xaa-Pro aminopeptidase
MEVHDEGNYDQLLQPGMALSIEQGVAPPDGPRVAFEDNVIVTPEGHDWISRSIPIEAADIETMAAKPSNLESFVKKRK